MVLKTALALCLGLWFSVAAYAQMSSEEVDKIVREHKLKEVDFTYVLEKIGNGTPAGATAMILDARPKARYEAGHIPTSYLMPDTQYKEHMGILKDKPKNGEIITYCQGPVCEKSALLATLLIKEGYTNVKVYRGGTPEFAEKMYLDIGLESAKKLYDSNKALFIDARPLAKFKQATIPGSLSLPDTEFKTLSGRLPSDIRTPVVLFCGGFECEKSHSIARWMAQMGYKNVMTLSAGLPGWIKAGYETTGGGTKAPAKEANAKPKQIGPVVLGADEGTVDVAWFREMIKNRPATIHLIDLRSPEEHAKGHIQGCKNIHRKGMSQEAFMAALPKEGYIIFTCYNGTRSLESYGDLKNKEGFKNRIFYLDAEVNCDASMKCDIKPLEM